MASLHADWTFRQSPDAPPLGLSAVFCMGGDLRRCRCYQSLPSTPVTDYGPVPQLTLESHVDSRWRNLA
jgi:hypothetical protein